MSKLTSFLLTLILTLICCHLVRAEEGVLVVQVSDLIGRSITGVVLTTTGDGSVSAPSAVAGKLRIKLASGTQPGDEVELVLIRASQDLVFISPWNQRVTVPCFANSTRCVAKVVLGVSGSRELLTNSQAQLAMVSKVNAANVSKVGIETLTEAQRQVNLAEVAKAFGYSPEEVDRAIRSLRKNTVDPYQLGQVALYERNYPEAEKQLLKSKTERMENLKKAIDELTDAKVKMADVSSSLGQTYYEQGRYKEAVKEYQEAVTLRQDDTATLNSLGNALHRAGQYSKAEPCYLRALEISEKALGSEHPDVATSLNNLALLYTDRGKYAEAEPLLRRALAIREMHLGAEHLDVAQSLNSLALLYKEQGRHAEAESLLKKALAIRELHLGTDHSDVAQILNSLGELYYARGRYASAESMYQRAISIWLKHLGPEHPYLATSLDNLATLYRAKGDYLRAEPLYRQALSIFEKMLDPDHTLFASSLSNLALLYEAKGDYAGAEPLHQRALSIFEKALGSDHPSVAIQLNNLAELYRAKGDLVKAVQYMSRGQEVREHNLSLILATGSERQKLAYLATLSGDTYSVVSLHARSAPTSTQALQLSLTTILRRKGRTLDAMINQVGSFRRLLNQQDRALLDRLSIVQSQLAALVLSGPGNLPQEEHKAVVSRLEEEVEKLQDAISRRSAEFRVQAQPITVEEVRQALPAGTALVEVFYYQPLDANAKTHAERFGSPRYIAYVLSREGEPLWADLGDAESINADVARLLTALKCAPTVNNIHACASVTQVKDLARALDERVMHPIRKLLGDARQVFLAPDGALNLVPFAALVDESGRYLVEQFSLTYLTSGRDLLRLQFNNESRQSPLIIADPLFDSNETGRRPALARGGIRARHRSDMERGYFSPLPVTAREARAISALLTDARVLTRAHATEAALKQASSPSLLHVATQGFFFPALPREASDDGEKRGLDEGAWEFAYSENPMLRSGLALVGANIGRSEGGEDGILTALEVAGLDLWGTKLVVLSACDTGVGKVEAGEGVFGMRRALMLAGSESQVLSLWQILDEATSELMVSYYKRLLAGEGRSEALRQTQLEMLRSENRDGHSHPYYWAAFIQSGDWRTMNLSSSTSPRRKT